MRVGLHCPWCLSGRGWFLSKSLPAEVPPSQPFDKLLLVCWFVFLFFIFLATPIGGSGRTAPTAPSLRHTGRGTKETQEPTGAEAQSPRARAGCPALHLSASSGWCRHDVWGLRLDAGRRRGSTDEEYTCHLDPEPGAPAIPDTLFSRCQRTAMRRRGKKRTIWAWDSEDRPACAWANKDNRS